MMGGGMRGSIRPELSYSNWALPVIRTPKARLSIPPPSSSANFVAARRMQIVSPSGLPHRLQCCFRDLLSPPLSLTGSGHLLVEAAPGGMSCSTHRHQNLERGARHTCDWRARGGVYPLGVSKGHPVRLERVTFPPFPHFRSASQSILSTNGYMCNHVKPERRRVRAAMERVSLVLLHPIRPSHLDHHHLFDRLSPGANLSVFGTGEPDGAWRPNVF